MKKILAVLAVLLCAFVVFAAGSFSAKLAPIAIQIATTSEDEEPVVSKYGIGAEVAYKYTCCGAFAQAGLSWNTYMLPEKRPNLTSLMVFGDVGFGFKLTDTLKASASVGIGGDTLIYDGTGSETITLRTGAGLGISLSEKSEVSVGCQGLFGFAKEDDVHYVNYRIIPVIGAEYKF